MSIRVAQIEAQIDGNKIIMRWEIPAEAHAVGLRAARGAGDLWLGDDLGTPEGVGALDAALLHGANAVRHRVSAQWNGIVPLF